MLIAYPIPAFYRQIDEPADALTGALWFNTSTNILKVLNSSSEWVNVAEEQDLILKLIGNNALNILDLTAQASLNEGINANFIRDTYKDANGYLNTISTANSNAVFETNYYKFINLSSSTNETTSAPAKDFTNNASITVNCLAKDNLIVSSLTFQPDGNTTATIEIKQNAQTIATKTESFTGTTIKAVSFSLSDYTRAIKEGQTFQVKITSSAGYNKQNSFSFDGNIFSFDAQTYFARGSSAGVIGIQATKVNLLTENKVQTNKQDLELTPTKFMIIANHHLNSENTSVLYNISFDNGANWQEDLEAFTEYEVIETGTELILKQRLITEEFSDIPADIKTYNYGVLIW